MSSAPTPSVLSKRSRASAESSEGSEHVRNTSLSIRNNLSALRRLVMRTRLPRRCHPGRELRLARPVLPIAQAFTLMLAPP